MSATRKAPAIDVNGVSKIYRTNIKQPGLRGSIKSIFMPEYTEKTAVNDLSFTVDTGERVGFIGVNGAGKSTTIKMLTGILLPTSGTIRIHGIDPYENRIDNARRISAVFGQRTQMWWDLALIESLKLTGKIYRMSDQRYRQRFDELVERLELQHLLRVPVRNMSLGQRMRSELATALIHDPQLVFLDEPTIGLDLFVKERIQQVIKDINETQQTTVFLTTHDLSDIEELCRRVIIIDGGQKIYDGSLQFIKERFGTHREITFESPTPASQFTLPTTVEMIKSDRHTFTLRFNRQQVSASQIATHIMEQADIKDFTLSEPNLYSIIKQIYNKEDLEDATPAYSAAPEG